MQKTKNIDIEISDILIERPIPFFVGNRLFYLYHPTLGKIILLSRMIESLEIDEELMRHDANASLLLACRNNREMVARIIAYHTLSTKYEIYDEDIVNERQKFFKNELSDEEMVHILTMSFSLQEIDSYRRHLGFDREQKRKERILRDKLKDGGSITFGGKSVYGSVFYFLAEHCGYTFQDVMWGISYANIQMLMSDAPVSLYLTKKERRNYKISDDGIVINADDKEKLKEYVKSQTWD